MNEWTAPLLGVGVGGAMKCLELMNSFYVEQTSSAVAVVGVRQLHNRRDQI